VESSARAGLFENIGACMMVGSSLKNGVAV